MARVALTAEGTYRLREIVIGASGGGCGTHPLADSFKILCIGMEAVIHRQ